MSSLSPNLEMCIHFLYSVTIYNDSAFYVTEIIVLISREGTPTQIRMRVGSITFHAFCQNFQCYYVCFFFSSFQLLFVVIHPPVFLKWLCLLDR